MGGGGAMRAAAKVAGIGVFNGGLRGIIPDHPVSAAARKGVRPVTAFAASSSSDSVKAAATIDASSVQKPCWELDDWELAGLGEDVLVAYGEATPRLVFGGSPTLQEAKEATTELKVALEKAYLSSPSTPISGLSQSSKACVTSENIVAPGVPKHAIQAFRFLNESPAVQSVVASITSDPNVWNAVLLNPTLQDFLHSQNIGAPLSNMDGYEKASKASTADGDILCPKSPRSFGRSSDFTESVSREPVSNNGFSDLWQNLKLTVVDMMNSLSDYFQTLFGDYSGDKVIANAKGNGVAGFLDKALGPSLMGLAVLVMVVVVLKRAQ